MQRAHVGRLKDSVNRGTESLSSGSGNPSDKGFGPETIVDLQYRVSFRGTAQQFSYTHTHTHTHTHIYTFSDPFPL